MNTTIPYLEKLFINGVVSLLTASLLSPVVSAAELPHVTWAESVALHVTPEKNEYGSNPTYVYWPGVNGATEYENRSQCSSFLTRVLKQAYGLDDDDFLAWTGSKNPTAALYHNTIEAENGFTRIDSVVDIQKGDILAIEYPQGLSSTGHVMIAHGPAILKTATEPFVNGTTQYTVEVIDSSQSGHGPEDTRRMTDNTWDTGAGIGTLRVYTNNNGSIMGYTWSTYKSSTYYAQNVRHLVIGRLP